MGLGVDETDTFYVLYIYDSDRAGSVRRSHVFRSDGQSFSVHNVSIATISLNVTDTKTDRPCPVLKPSPVTTVKQTADRHSTPPLSHLGTPA